MPYKSDSQRRFFHTEAAKKAGITPEMVNEFNKASKDMSLPEAIKKHKQDQRRRKMWVGGEVEKEDYSPDISESSYQIPLPETRAAQLAHIDRMEDPDELKPTKEEQDEQDDRSEEAKAQRSLVDALKLRRRGY